MSDDGLDRRQLIQGIGGVIASMKLAVLAGCSDATTPGTPPGSSGTSAGSSGTTGGTSSSGSSGSSSGAGVCELYPQQTEGPFYLDEKLLRKDITEGKSGVPLTLRLTVLGAGACTPIAGAVVDIWHNDAGGVYSGYPDQVGSVDTTGQKFLRGMQTTNAAGEVEFTTIYPGWYPGRTTHIHFKVHLGGGTLVTSQMYFPEEINEAVYRTPVYAARGQKDTSNAQDGIARGAGALLSVTGDATTGYVASLAITVKAA